MGDAYNFYQHTYCIPIYWDDTYFLTSYFYNRERDWRKMNSYKERTCILYNKDKTKILARGIAAHDLSKNNNRNDENVYVDNFMNELNRIYLIDKEERDEKDTFLLQTATYYLRLQIDRVIEGTRYATQCKLSKNDLHYIVVISNEWKYNIGRDLIRPMFIQANLISSNDHNDRLLFVSKLDSIFQIFQQAPSDWSFNGFSYQKEFRSGRQYIMCRVNSTEENMSLNFEIFEATYSMTAFRGVKLIPRLLQSTQYTINLNSVRSRLEIFLKNRVLTDNALIDEDKLAKIVDNLMGDYFRYNEQTRLSGSRFFGVSRDLAVEYLFEEFDAQKWDLDENEQLVSRIKSITASDMHHAAYDVLKEDLENHLRGLLLNDLVKMRTAIIVDEGYLSSRKWTIDDVLQSYEMTLNYKMLVYNDILSISPQDISRGALLKAMEAIKDTDENIPPCLINNNSSDNADFLPNIMVKITISFSDTRFSCVQLSSDHRGIGSIDNINDTCDSIHILGHFFTTSNFDIPVTLNIQSWVLKFMEDRFEGVLDFFCKFDRHNKQKRNSTFSKMFEMEENIKERFFKKSTITSGSSILKQKEEFANLFGKSCSSYTIDSDLVQIQQQRYIKVFLAMYLGYLNELVMNRLSKSFGPDFMNERIGYAFSVEKNVLDTLVGTKEDFKELLFASSILVKDDDTRRAHIYTQGDGLLPVIQQKLDLSLPLKSYYVLAQLHEDYVQLTLHQVVRISSSPEEDAATIVVQDKLIPMENVYDSAYLNIWNQAESTGELIKFCDIHKGNGELLQDFYTLKNYKEFMDKMKKHIPDNFFAAKESSLEIDNKEKVEINSACSCSMYLSAADIIDVAFRPVIQNIACLIAASLVNVSLFGAYSTIPHIFVLDNTFTGSEHKSSLLQVALGRILQESLDDSIEYKEIGIQSVTALGSLIDLPLMAENADGMRRSFIKRNLYQVSGETYAFHVLNTPNYDDRKYQKKISSLYRSGDSTTFNIVNDNQAVVLLRRGQILTNDGYSQTWYLELEEGNYVGTASIYLIRLRNSDGSYDGIIPFEDHSYDVVQPFHILYKSKRDSNNLKVPIMIKVKPVNNTSSLRFSANLVGMEDGDMEDTDRYKTTCDVGEQLTVAYL